ncbi:MAG: hypothetical protein EXS05_09475 [Planctomycetaceae bacterium]|nr:hypothetical protein [Planctomycetaceae bacterium]
MLNRSFIRACILSATLGALSAAAVAEAGLFDRLKPRRAVATTTRRGQSPEPYSAPAVGAWQSSTGEGTSAPWYTEPAPPTLAYGAAESYCCGPEDKYAHLTQHCRKSCHQTYYTPVPPYCYPCYGVTPTCWRRMQECAICPREPAPAPPTARKPSRTSGPKVLPPTPAVLPPVPAEPTEPPEPMDDDEPAAYRTRTRSRVTGVGSEREQARPAARSRWTGYADALPDDEIPEAPLDTLEEQVAAEEAQLESPADDTDAEAADEEFDEVEPLPAE